MLKLKKEIKLYNVSKMYFQDGNIYLGRRKLRFKEIFGVGIVFVY